MLEANILIEIKKLIMDLCYIIIRAKSFESVF